MNFHQLDVLNEKLNQISGITQLQITTVRLRSEPYGCALNGSSALTSTELYLYVDYHNRIRNKYSVVTTISVITIFNLEIKMMIVIMIITYS